MAEMLFKVQRNKGEKNLQIWPGIFLGKKCVLVGENNGGN